MKFLLLCCCLIFAFNSCKKKVFELVPILTVEKQMNIDGAGNIRYFSFPTEQTGYAASDSSFIYKTINGGDNWTKLQWVNNKRCKGIEFFDELNGMCLMDDIVYVTSDGGSNWAASLNADFIAISDDGLTGITGTCTDMTCDISTSSDKGQSFSLNGTAPIKGSFSFVEIDGTNVILFGEEVYSYDFTFGYELSNGEIKRYDFEDLTFDAMPSDFYHANTKGFLTGHQGVIQENSHSNVHIRNYYVHNYNYHSTDGFGNTVICVGDNTITTNLAIDGESEWREVVDSDRNGFKQNFYNVKCINQNSFYLSGSNGTLMRAKL